VRALTFCVFRCLCNSKRKKCRKEQNAAKNDVGKSSSKDDFEIYSVKTNQLVSPLFVHLIFGFILSYFTCKTNFVFDSSFCLCFSVEQFSNNFCESKLSDKSNVWMTRKFIVATTKTRNCKTLLIYNKKYQHYFHV